MLLPHNPEVTCTWQLKERQVVTTIWANMQQLLTDKNALNSTLRHLTQMLTPVDTIPPEVLPALTLLHLGSCNHLKNTARLLTAAAAAVKDNVAPQAALQTTSHTEPEAAAAAAAEGSTDSSTDGVLGVIDNLIELQLFHLFRVRAIAAQMRAYRQAAAGTAVPPKRQYVYGQLYGHMYSQGPHTTAQPASSSSSSSDDLIYDGSAGGPSSSDELASTEGVESLENILVAAKPWQQ